MSCYHCGGWTRPVITEQIHNIRVVKCLMCGREQGLSAREPSELDMTHERAAMADIKPGWIRCRSCGNTRCLKCPKCKKTEVEKM